MALHVHLALGAAHRDSMTAPRSHLPHTSHLVPLRILSHGECGYTNSDGTLPFAREGYAASADANYDYPGSCGRCYQIKCVDGAVAGAGGRGCMGGSCWARGRRVGVR